MDPQQKRLNENKQGINEPGKGALMCEAANCFEEAITAIEVEVGHYGTISLSLCNICAKKFVGDGKKEETGDW